MNTRDLGGLPLEKGGHTRYGVYYRSDIPMGLAQNDFALLAQHGLTTVIDLRRPLEIERDLSSLQGRDGLNWHHVEVWGRIDEASSPKDHFNIVAFYLAALDHAGPAFVDAMNILANSEGAALYHCTAGKDRTGLVSLMLLELAGVPTEVIIDDFALTHDRIGPLRERLLADAEKNGVAREDMASLLGATPDLIIPAIEHLHQRHGGAEEYLTRHGVTEETLGRLRTRLTQG